MIPKDGFPLKERVVLHWNEHQVPFIEASTDVDLATALGLVHAHLRLGQMEMVRRTAQGRLAEMIGPLGVADFTATSSAGSRSVSCAARITKS